MRYIYLGLKFAFSYFSILPIRFSSDDNLSKKKVLAFMLYFFPLVGFVISLISVGLVYLLEDFSWLGMFFGGLLYMILYGFLHLEAVMDVADGIYAKHGGKDAYSIIKEPTVGALGVFWGVSFFVVKLALLVYVFELGYFYEFITIAVVSRFGLTVMIKTQDFNSSFVCSLQKAIEQKSLLIVGLIVFLVSPWYIFVLGLVFVFLGTKFIKRNLGFINGDALGASLEFSEIALLCSLILCQ